MEIKNDKILDRFYKTMKIKPKIHRFIDILFH